VPPGACAGEARLSLSTPSPGAVLAPQGPGSLAGTAEGWWGAGVTQLAGHGVDSLGKMGCSQRRRQGDAYEWVGRPTRWVRNRVQVVAIVGRDAKGTCIACVANVSL